jgi:hypothetical protein
MGYWHGLYDTVLYNEFHENKCTFAYGGFENNTISAKCNDLLDTFNDLTTRINIYDVYGICYAPGPTKSDTFELY